MVHRVGEVKVGEASVAIAVSSVHRRPALEAVHFIIDEIKATVPIWKEEIYQDGSMWKQNAEFEQRFLRKTDLIDEGEHRTSSV